MTPGGGPLVSHPVVLSLEPIRDRLDVVGIVEHARGPVPAPDFGHCSDDAGRALGLASLLPDEPSSDLVAAACLRQLAAMRSDDGAFLLRLDADGHPTDDPPSDDASARATWGLAVASVAARDAEVRHGAAALLAELDVCSPFPRAAAHLVLAGAALLEADEHSSVGRRLLQENVASLPLPQADDGSAWRWPEARLTYGSALISEALMAAGAATRDPTLTSAGLTLLDWLIALQVCPDGSFSFVPSGGRGPGDGPGFDQQPIEAWTTADACRRAFVLTGDDRWYVYARSALAWFEGDNDVGVAVWNPRTGAAFDGLTPTGINPNEGTESTLALIGTARVERELRGQLWSARRRSSSR